MKLLEVKSIWKKPKARPMGPADLAEAIKRDCKPFLNASGYDPKHRDTWLYRGAEGNFSNDLYRVKESRADREPKDTPLYVHKELDNALEELTGIKFRSSGIFTGGKKFPTWRYGDKTCVVFPIGEFDYCWSTVVEDAYLVFTPKQPHFKLRAFGGPRTYTKKDFDEDLEKGDLSKYFEILRKFVVSGKADYRFNRDLKEALKSKSEIMISCKTYYLVSNGDALAKAWDDPTPSE